MAATQPLTARRNAIRVWTWISKALLVRNHPAAIKYAERLFELFADTNEDVAAAAARAIGEIPASTPVLTKPTHAIIRVSTMHEALSASSLTDSLALVRSKVL
jgi:DNA repair/transcription protein MET18/MMS19